MTQDSAESIKASKRAIQADLESRSAALDALYYGPTGIRAMFLTVLETEAVASLSEDRLQMLKSLFSFYEAAFYDKSSNYINDEHWNAYCENGWALIEPVPALARAWDEYYQHRANPSSVHAFDACRPHEE